MIDNQCSNKNCPDKASLKGTTQKKAVAKKSGIKSPSSRRSSKVLTYNLNDTEEE